MLRANGVGRRVNEETKDAENETQKREKRKMERIRRQKQNKNENSCFIKTYVFFKTYICSWYVVRYTMGWQRSTERSEWEEETRSSSRNTSTWIERESVVLMLYTSFFKNFLRRKCIIIIINRYHMFFLTHSISHMMLYIVQHQNQRIAYIYMTA